MKVLFSFIAYILSLLLLTAVGFTAWNFALPPTIATHFDSHGVANGSMSAKAFVLLMAFTGVAITAIPVGMIYFVRFLPPALLNVPNSDYWRVPANFRRACDYLMIMILWAGVAMAFWLMGVIHSVVEANRVTPPHLDMSFFWALTFSLVIFTTGWTGALLLWFLKKR